MSRRAVSARAWAVQARAAVPAVVVAEGGRAGVCLSSGEVAVRAVPGRALAASWPRVRAALRGLLPAELPADAAPLRGRWRVEQADAVRGHVRLVLTRRCGRVDLRVTVEADAGEKIQESPILGAWSCAWEVSRRARGRSSGAPAVTGGGGWPEAIGGAWRAALELEGASCSAEGLTRRGASPGAAARLRVVEAPAPPARGEVEPEAPAPAPRPPRAAAPRGRARQAGLFG